MNSKRSILFLSLAIAGLYACKKDNNHETDTEKPVINIIEPAANDSFPGNGDSVHVELYISDNDELHEVTMKITNPADSIVFSDSAHLDQSSFSYHRHYYPSGISATTAMKLSVSASDHHGNVDTKSLTFYLKP
jgi:hypothetical protein